jgi:drug/metabolite transporter (DMT)-like permease
MSKYAPKTLAYLALAVICVVWGTTYTAIKLGVRDFPPFLMVGIRQTAAGLLLLNIAIFSGKITNFRRFRPSFLNTPDEATSVAPIEKAYAGRQMLIGLATITGGNGFITWGMQYVSSGIASIIGALTPVVVLLIGLVWHRRGERLSWLTVAGVGLGFAGLGFVFHDGWADFFKPDYRWGIAGCFASCFTWSLGTVMAKRWNSPAVPPVANAALQVTGGGLGGLVLSALFDQSHTIHHTWQGWTALVYLIVVGSALAFTLYMFVLQHLSATAASVYTYINPVVAVLLGWMMLAEPLTLAELAGLGFTLTGIWLVNRGEQRTAAA